MPVYSVEGSVAQTQPLVQDKVDVTSGTFSGVTLITCNVDGNVTLTWNDGSTKTKDFAEGMSRQFRGISITINSGSFDLA